MKKVLNSKVVWLNVAVLILSLFDKEFFSVFGISESITIQIMAITTKIVAILNIVLRVYFTSEPIDNPLK